MPLRELLSTTGFRLSSIYAALLLGAAVLAGAGGWISTQNLAEQRLRADIALEMQALTDLQDADTAMRDVAARVADGGHLEYRLWDGAGARRLGPESEALPSPGWREVVLPQQSGREIFLTRRLADGSLLSIGENLNHAEAVREAALGQWIALGALSAVLAILLGYLATRRTLRHFDDLSGVLQAVANGDLTVRAAAAPGGSDSVGKIATGVNRMLDRIAALVANVRRVSTEVAHDLRTPLTHVLHDLEAAAATDGPEARALVNSAMGRIGGVLRTFDAMLRLAEIEAGSSRSRFAQVKLADLAEHVADAYRPDVESNGGRLSVEAAADLQIEGDRDLLAQALANLIENAMKHAGEGALIKIGVAQPGDRVRLFVEDNGRGVPAASREEVLAPYVRLDQSRSSAGSGLGLSIVAAIARLHGAELTLQDAGPGLRVLMEWRR